MQAVCLQLENHNLTLEAVDTVSSCLADSGKGEVALSHKYTSITSML